MDYLITEFGITACSTKKTVDNILIPNSYLIHLRWSGNNENNNNFLYYTNTDICSIYLTDDNYLVSQKRDFNIKKAFADSIYLLAYNNSKHFDIADTSFSSLIDGEKLSITLRVNDKSIENSYSGLSNFSVNEDITQIIRIIRHVTKDSTILN